MVLIDWYLVVVIIGCSALVGMIKYDDYKIEKDVENHFGTPRK